MRLFRLGTIRRTIKYTVKGTKLVLNSPYLVLKGMIMIVAAPFVGAYYALKVIVLFAAAVFNFFYSRRTATNAFRKRPKTEEITGPRYICIPKGLTPYNEQYYYVILGTFQAAGFTNVICLNLEDMDANSPYKEEQVKDVMINSVQVRPGMGPFISDVPIIVTYHGKKVKR